MENLDCSGVVAGGICGASGTSAFKIENTSPRLITVSNHGNVPSKSRIALQIYV
jgi:hypothetical protein